MKHRYQSGEGLHEVEIERHGNGYRATIDGEVYDMELLDAQPGEITLRFIRADGSLRAQTVYWGADGDVRWLSSGGCTYRLDRPTARRSRGMPGAAAEDTLRAPMPAQVKAVFAAEGDSVEAGQPLVLLEAMKMEIKVAATRAATVVRLFAKEGDQVQRDQVLVELR